LKPGRLSPAAPTIIINTTSAAHYVAESLSSDRLSKLAMALFTAFVNAEHQHIISVSLYPAWFLQI
jgi:hypothetical protein